MARIKCYNYSQHSDFQLKTHNEATALISSPERWGYEGGRHLPIYLEAIMYQLADCLVKVLFCGLPCSKLNNLPTSKPFLSIHLPLLALLPSHEQAAPQLSSRSRSQEASPSSATTVLSLGSLDLLRSFSTLCSRQYGVLYQLDVVLGLSSNELVGSFQYFHLH